MKHNKIQNLENQKASAKCQDLLTQQTIPKVDIKAKNHAFGVVFADFSVKRETRIGNTSSISSQYIKSSMYGLDMFRSSTKC